jgi:hypothetical protein
MKISYLVMIGVLVLSMMSACSNETHDTYTIARKGEFLRHENFDVIHVYGFSDNGEVARQITAFLNESEPETYHYYHNE